jgi:uncharacterized membrane protein YkgB
MALFVFGMVLAIRKLMVNQMFSVQAFSNLLGTMEIAIAVMIGLRSLSPKVSVIGSVLAIVPGAQPGSKFFKQ